MIWALRKEVKSTPHEHDMFRLDSAASKLMGAYGLLIAKSWLRDLLKNTIKKATMTVAKNEKEKEKEKEIPVQRIWKMIDSMLEFLVSNMSQVPFPLRVLCFYIKEEVEKRFPGKGNIGVAAFVFLRLICPAIVAPETRGVSKSEPTIQLRKLLVRTARELQQLVNTVNRGMTLTSDMYGETTEQVTFVGLNLERIKTFLDGVATKTLDNEIETDSSRFSPLKKSQSQTLISEMKSEELCLTWLTEFVARNRVNLMK